MLPRGALCWGMVTPRPAAERGRTRLEWLDSRHTFSFGDYHDPRHMGFRALRVINDDRVAPGRGFGRHSHRDMEILTYVLDGALEHQDSLGTGSVIRPGDLQRMSAGRGVAHSEWNHSADEPVRFLQIWILPERPGLDAGYEQWTFAEEDLRDQLRPIASRAGGDGFVTVHQDASVLATRLGAGRQVEHALAPGRHAWVQVARGSAALNGTALAEGDGAAVSQEPVLTLRGLEDAEVLVFDLA
jgi:quercetin 2,3-dioxygenase